MDEETELEEELAGRRWYRRLSVPALLGLACGVAPFFLKLDLNGLSFVALVGGGLAVLLGLVAIGWALLRSTSKLAGSALGLLVVALGAFQLFSSGFAPDLGGPTEEDARALLREDGFEEIVFTGRSEDGRGFQFEAYREGERCLGSVRIDGSLGGSSSVNRTEMCGLPQPLERVVGRCEGGEAEACVDAAARLRDEEPVDLVRATTLSVRACELGRAAECFYVGVAHDHGDRGLAQDLSAALRHYERACEGGDRVGCFNAALMLMQGRGVDAQDDVRGCARARQGCDREFEAACELLGQCYRDARGGLEEDLVRARQLFGRACDADEPEGCVNLASLLLYGRGGAEDRPQALTLYRRACDAEHRVGCRMSAVLAVQGEDPARSVAEGAQRLDALCREGDGASCFELGVFVHEAEHLATDPPRARQLFERGCEAGHRIACWNASVFHDDGLGGPADPVRSRTLAERACELGHERACRAVGRAG